MKLVEILARELGEWPENIEAISQAGDMQASHYISMAHEWNARLGDWSDDGYIPCSRFRISKLATDHSTAIVTREMWQAERDKQAAIQVGIDAANTGCLKPLSEVKARYNGPTQWRDRITTIDFDIHSLTAERADLVQKLASEGFALIGRVLDPVEDYGNIQIGDLVSVISIGGFSDCTGLSVGDIAEVTSVDNDESLKTVSGGSWGSIGYNYKFHSRHN